uniref:Uncharacterized protein n=1 Tax=Streptomyces sp. NBC_00049 TaxID=2903617 RepID=A0AAU2JYS7_9ACTN
MTANAPVPLTPRAPGLTRRARSFVETHGLRAPSPDPGPYRDVWLGHGIPAAVIDRAVAFHDRRGGIVLPPAPAYEGGPRVLEADAVDASDLDGYEPVPEVQGLADTWDLGCG